MGRSFQLGTIFGIPFRVDYSWFVIFLLVTTLLSLSYFPTRYPLWGQAEYWVVGIAPAFDIEGRPLADFLGWVSRETGWSLDFPSRELEESVQGVPRRVFATAGHSG